MRDPQYAIRNTQYVLSFKMNPAPPEWRGRVAFAEASGLRVQAAVDGAEHLADLTAQQAQDADDDDRDQHEDERVLDQTLALFLGEEAAKHCRFLLVMISAVQLCA